MAGMAEMRADVNPPRAEPYACSGFAKLTNGHLVLRPGERILSQASGSGWAWFLTNGTERVFRVRVGTELVVGEDLWEIEAVDGLARMNWKETLLPHDD